MQINCPTINSIKSYLQVELPKAREIHGILSGVSSVRRYKLVQELLDEATTYRNLPQFLQMYAVLDVLKIEPKDCALQIEHISGLPNPVTITLYMPEPYDQYGLRWNDNTFTFTKDKSE